MQSDEKERKNDDGKRGRENSQVVFREDVVLPLSLLTGLLAVVALFSGRYVLSLEFAVVSLGLLWMANHFYGEEEK